MSVSREWLVDLLSNLGYEDAAQEAANLPETFTMDQLIQFGDEHGISRSDLVDRMGGSP